jgi:hypothetical protein
MKSKIVLLLQQYVSITGATMQHLNRQFVDYEQAVVAIYGFSKLCVSIVVPMVILISFPL